MADSNRDLQERRVVLSEQREARFQRAAAQREEREARQDEKRASRDYRAAARTAGQAPGRFARTVTQRSGTYSGKGTLAGLLLAGFVIVAIRLVADAEVSDDGTTVRANVLHPQGELGPVPILAALIATFFVLSFVAIGGGLRAKLAVIMGGAIVLTLGVRSLDEIKFAGSMFGKIGTVTTPAPSGQLADIYGNGGQAGQAPGSLNAASIAGGVTHTILGALGAIPGKLFTLQYAENAYKDAYDYLKSIF